MWNVEAWKNEKRMNWQRRGSARVRVGGSPGGGAGFGLQQILWSRCQPDSSDKRFHRESCFWSQQHTIENYHYKLCGTYSWTRVRKIMMSMANLDQNSQRKRQSSATAEDSPPDSTAALLFGQNKVFSTSAATHSPQLTSTDAELRQNKFCVKTACFCFST